MSRMRTEYLNGSEVMKLKDRSGVFCSLLLINGMKTPTCTVSEALGLFKSPKTAQIRSFIFFKSSPKTARCIHFFCLSKVESL